MVPVVRNYLWLILAQLKNHRLMRAWLDMNNLGWNERRVSQRANEMAMSLEKLFMVDVPRIRIWISLLIRVTW